MSEIQDAAQTTGGIIIVEMYAGIIITMVVVAIVDIIKKLRKKNKRK